jgi:DNA-binding response OmpR family regulator
MKFLIVEDEPNLQKLITYFLKKEDHITEEALTYKEAKQKLDNFSYDVIILDINLPDGSGLSLLPIIKELHPGSATIIVSAKDSIEDRVKGLEQGADDYLIKPFHVSELNARIKAIIRRKFNIVEDIVTFGDFTFHFDSRMVEVRGLDLELTKKEDDILLYLYRNKNRVVTKDSLAEHLWGDHMDDTYSFDFLYAHLKNLRKKLAKMGVENYLNTLYGVGYKFIIPNT